MRLVVRLRPVKITAHHCIPRLGPSCMFQKYAGLSGNLKEHAQHGNAAESSGLCLRLALVCCPIHLHARFRSLGPFPLSPGCLGISRLSLGTEGRHQAVSGSCRSTTSHPINSLCYLSLFAAPMADGDSAITITTIRDKV